MTTENRSWRNSNLTNEFVLDERVGKKLKQNKKINSVVASESALRSLVASVLRGDLR